MRNLIKFSIPKGIVYLCLFLTMGGILIIFTFADSSAKTEKQIPSQPINLTVSGIQLPDHLEFAGETVPIQYFDVKESLDRELLINSYWQSQTMLLIKRSSRYMKEIEPILKKKNIPDDFKYLALAESGFINVTSQAGAVGFWQFVPSTAREYGLEINSEVDERYQLEKSTTAACQFLQESYNLYKSWTMAAASYNMGRKALGKQIQRQRTSNYYDILVSEETARYVFRILALKLILSNPQKYGFTVTKEDYYQPVPYSEVVVTQTVKDLAEFAFSQGTNYKILKQLNPWLRDNTLTMKEGRSYIIRIPAAGFREHGAVLTKADSATIANHKEEE